MLWSVRVLASETVAACNLAGSDNRLTDLYLLFFFSLFSVRFSLSVFSGFFFTFFFESIPLDMTTSLVHVHRFMVSTNPRSLGQHVLTRIGLPDQSFKLQPVSRCRKMAE